MTEMPHHHVFPVRVYYEDTDAVGIVYHANYLKYAERARTEMLRDMGIECSRMMTEQGFSFTVRRCLLDYYKPAMLDDALEVRSTINEVRGASVIALQRVMRDDEELARLEFRLACTSMDGGPMRMPPVVRDAIETYLNTNQRK